MANSSGYPGDLALHGYREKYNGCGCKKDSRRDKEVISEVVIVKGKKVTCRAAVLVNVRRR